MSAPKTITVRDLLDELKGLSPDDYIYFGSGDVSLFQVKRRGERLYNIEFNEVYVVTSDPETES